MPHKPSWLSRLSPLVFVLGLAVPVALWLYIGWYPAQKAWVASSNDGRSSSEKFGTYGDGFGAVNSLASSLALGGVAIALFFQWREQHDARLKADEDRIEIEKGRKHDAELAMLAARIHAEAVLMEHQFSSHAKLEAGFNKVMWVTKEAREARERTIELCLEAGIKHKENLARLAEEAARRMDFGDANG